MGSRKTGLTLSLPLVLGSVAFYMGRRSPGEHSHSWTIYIRSVDGTDLSFLVEKVVFTLHPSCSQPVVVVEKPPFQVSQTGWGEFEAAITIHFKNGLENPITNAHFLRLFPGHAPDASQSTTVPVVSEAYDEFLFVNPSTELYDLLTDRNHPDKIPEQGFSQMSQYFKDFKTEEAECRSKINEANEFVKKEIQKAVEELRALS